jgi:hypothetical protein
MKVREEVSISVTALFTVLIASPVMRLLTSVAVAAGVDLVLVIPSCVKFLILSSTFLDTTSPASLSSGKLFSAEQRAFMKLYG